MNTEQKGIKELSAAITRSGANIAVAAAVVALVALVLPFLGVKSNLGMGLDGAGSLNGFAAAGWAAWLTIIAFVAAAASRHMAAMTPYRDLIDIAAVIMVPVTIICAWFFNPITTEMKQLEGVLLGSTNGSGGPKPLTFYPHIGMAFLVLAAGGIILAHWKDGGLIFGNRSKEAK